MNGSIVERLCMVVIVGYSFVQSSSAKTAW